MATYHAVWRIEINAETDAEARSLHLEALREMEDAPCSVWVRGDGPVKAQQQAEES